MRHYFIINMLLLKIMSDTYKSLISAMKSLYVLICFESYLVYQAPLACNRKLFVREFVFLETYIKASRHYHGDHNRRNKDYHSYYTGPYDVYNSIPKIFI